MLVPLDGSGDEIGKMLADGISDLMNTRQKGRIATREGNNGDYYGMPEPGNQPDKGTLYRVQTGAYKVKSNAERQLAKLCTAGFDAFIS